MTFHTHNPPPISLSSINFLHLTVSEMLPGQNFIGQGHYSKVKSRSDHDEAHLHLLTNAPTKYQLPTLCRFYDIARTIFYRSSSLWQGQRSNQGHTMMLHTYTPKPMSLQSINFLHLDIARTRFYRSRSLWQGQIKVRP